MVNPGTYLVRLTVDGKSYTQPVTVKQDPRVRTPAATMQQIYGTVDAAQDAQAAMNALTDLREQAEALKPTASGAAATALARFDSLAGALLGVSATVAPAAGGGRGGRGGGFGGRGGGGGAAAPGSLAAAAGALGGLANTLAGADAPPTASQVQAIASGRREAAAAMAKWNAFRITEVPALNRALRAAGLKEVAVTR
jgi:hypothetical protein